MEIWTFGTVEPVASVTRPVIVADPICADALAVIVSSAQSAMRHRGLLIPHPFVTNLGSKSLNFEIEVIICQRARKSSGSGPIVQRFRNVCFDRAAAR